MDDRYRIDSYYLYLHYSLDVSLILKTATVADYKIAFGRKDFEDRIIIYEEYTSNPYPVLAYTGPPNIEKTVEDYSNKFESNYSLFEKNFEKVFIQYQKNNSGKLTIILLINTIRS